ncbi:MAG: hypothetical protein ACXWKH_11115 [Limisphaerales bacterium]
MKLTATSFATRQDLANFCRAIMKGKNWRQALSIGDNGIGAWDTPTWDPDGPPMCALPKGIARAHGQFKITMPESITPAIVSCEDISPPGIVDLNPAALKALGFHPDTDLKLDNVDVVELT